MFAHLNPAIPNHPNIDDDMRLFVLGNTILRPFFRGHILGQGQKRALRCECDIVLKRKARFEMFMDVRHVHSKTRIAHDEDILCIKQGESFLDRF